MAFFVFILFLLSFSSENLWANYLEPLRGISEFNQYPTEKVLNLSQAQVITADYELIRKDFFWLRNKSESEIDKWLVENGAIIAESQYLSNNVRMSYINAKDLKHQAIRPPEYRRALVVPVRYRKSTRYLDIKGVGSKHAENRSHYNGLASVPELLREYLFEKQISEIFKTYYPHLNTVGSYAVLDLGFTFRSSVTQFLSFRAGAILRQAHHRHYSRNNGDNPTMPSVMPRAKQLEIELALRKFGITTSTVRSGQIMNVQGSVEGALVDFGGINVRQSFQGPIFSYYEGTDHDGEVLILDQNEAELIQPDPNLALKPEIWGHFKGFPKLGKTQLSFIKLMYLTRPGQHDFSKMKEQVAKFYKDTFVSYKTNCQSRLE